MNRTLSTIVGSFVLLCACVAHAADVRVTASEDLQAKLNAARSGDRVIIDQRRISQTYEIKVGGITITQPDSTHAIMATHGGFAFKAKDVDGVTFTGCTFIGGGISPESCDNWTITGNTFKDIRNSWASNNAIYFNGARRFVVERNTFQNIRDGGDTGIFGYTPKVSRFNFNRFIDVHEGIHIWFDDSATDRGDNEVIGNHDTGGDRHNIELQGRAYGLKVTHNHISQRRLSTRLPDGRMSYKGMGISGAVGGKDVSDGITDTSRDVLIANNVIDFKGAGPRETSQNCGIEVMGETTVQANYMRATGQGLLYGQTAPAWKSINNKFVDVDVSHQPEPGSGSRPPGTKTGNIEVRSTATQPHDPPTYAQLIATIGQPTTQPDVPPIAPTTLAARAFKSMVHVTHTPGAKVEKRAGDNVWRAVTLDDGYDKGFTADQVANKWVWFYKATLNGISSPEVRVQLNLDTNPADPAPMPVPPPPQPIGTWLKGDPWDVFAIPDGAQLKLTATTRPTNATVSQ